LPLREATILFAWTAVFYFIRIQFSIEPVTLQTAAVGDIFMLVGMLKLRRTGQYRFWTTVGIVLSLVHLSSRLAALLGFGDVYNMSLESLSQLCILFLLLRASEVVARLRSYRFAIIATIVSVFVTFGFLIAGLLSLGVVLALQQYLSRLKPLVTLSSFLGMFVPTMLMYLVSTGLSLYVMIAIARALSVRNFNAAPETAE